MVACERWNAYIIDIVILAYVTEAGYFDTLFEPCFSELTSTTASI